MEGLISLLAFAGLFYVMMRFGCGAHMTHGHKSRHATHDNGNAKRIDPVCGMEVKTEEGYGKMHKKDLYRFCSRKCLDKFEDNPGRYIQTAVPNSGGKT